MPKFSVIIPVYNVATYLRKCLESVLAAAKGLDVEIVCVDDGSTDDSGTILNEYAAKDPRFHVIHQTNQGVARTRQVALEHCTGEWLCAVDPDDWVEPGFLRAFDDAIREGPVDIIWCDYFRDRDSSARVSTRTAENAARHIEAILQDRVWGSLCNKAFSKRFVDASGARFPPKGCNTAEDMVFLCDCLLHDPVIKWIPDCNYHYVYRAGSQCNPGSNLEAYTPFIKSIEYLDALLARAGRKEALRFRKQQIKFGMYDKPYITAERFDAAFPDVRDLKGMPVGVWHKVLFRVAARGGRRQVLWLLKVGRAILKPFRSR